MHGALVASPCRREIAVQEELPVSLGGVCLMNEFLFHIQYFLVRLRYGDSQAMGIMN